jgi:thymidylate kinase
MMFVALEGFSGTGKTSLALRMEGMGWLRLQESAHAVNRDVPLADRADTASDYSLLGATMTYSSVIARRRDERDIVSEGYLISDLAYAKIRMELGKSTAYPQMLSLVRGILSEPRLRPDLYIRLKAGAETIIDRQRGKDDREKNLTEFFRTRYYTALDEIHEELGEEKVETVETESDVDATLGAVVAVLEKRRVVTA